MNRRLPLLFALLAGILFPPDTGNAASAREEREECARNMQAIYKAIQSYRNQHKQLPDRLSSLIPDHLQNPNILICPVARRTGEISNYGLSDPKITTSYVYEFCNHAIPDSIHGGSNHTMQEWKQLQMAMAGSIVPMVRCHHHSPVLNLSFAGDIYESQESWEADISGVVRPEHLAPKHLFEKFGNSGARNNITIDLEDYFNCTLTQTLHSQTGAEAGHSLSMIPDGRQVMGGVAFDIEGVLHLQGSELINIAPDRYPREVEGISINLKTPRLHFLIGAGWPSADGAEVAHFEVNFEDGQSARIPVRYNREVTDWLHGIVTGANTPRLAWSGDMNPSPNEEQVVHLYRISWNNPRPNTTIQSIDAVSAMKESAVFIMGISADRPN